MTTNAKKALKCEADFLSAVEANFEDAKGEHFRGSTWQRAEADDIDRLKELMAKAHRYDRKLLKSLPSNRRVAIHGFDRRFLFWKRRTGVAIASVLSPLEHYASGADSDAPPIGLGEMLDHTRHLAGDRKVTHVIGVCSPTGFTEEARNARLDMPNATVVLIEPDGAGGWSTRCAGGAAPPWLLEMFDPEGMKGKVERVGALISDRSADLLTGGLSVSSVVRNSNLPESVVRRGFEQVAAADPELMLASKGGEVLLYRGAAVLRQESSSMNVIDRIKQLFSGEGDEAEKINLLSERRATLAQRRDRIYEDIGKLETKEANLLAQGKSAKSSVPRRRLAAQLAQLRKDISRQNTTAAMLNKQIDIISTDIHNLTLIRQGEAAKLPTSAELTDHAVQAEEMLETLTADSELVGDLETGIEATLASEEEMAILKEFEDADEPAKKTETPPDSVRAKSAPVAESKARSVGAESAGQSKRAEPESQEQDEIGDRADPEAT